MKHDLLVDGNSLFARCWYAVDGDPDQVLPLCVKQTLVLLDQNEGRIGFPIHRTLFGWDGKAKTEKNRDPKPKDYIETRYRFQEVLLPLFNTVHGYHPEFEADDVVASACFNSDADVCVVVSGDKDLMQLQDARILYYCLNTKAIVSPRNICSKFGVKRPDQVAIAQAILGDRGDGISGIPKWGPKKVGKLFEAVKPEMSFKEALDVILAQIPEELQQIFLDSLDKTLLHTEVDGLPDPSPLRFCSAEELRDLGIPGISMAYDQVAMQYEGGPNLEEMVRGSKGAAGRPTAGRSTELP